ncbi:MAG: hypothetical protein WC211_03715 [Dehalococcoidia bacterium]
MTMKQRVELIAWAGMLLGCVWIMLMGLSNMVDSVGAWGWHAGSGTGLQAVFGLGCIFVGGVGVGLADVMVEAAVDSIVAQRRGW